MKTNILLTIILILPFLSSFSKATQIISPFAVDLPSSNYTQSSYYPGLTAGNAFNGGQWNAGGYGYHWIQADMGTIQTLSEVKITIQQVPNGYSVHQIYLSDNPIGNSYSSLTPIYAQAGGTYNHQVLDVIFETPQSGRYLEILSYGGPSWTALGDGAARVDWEDPITQTISVPTTFWLFGSCLIGLAGYLRKKT